MKAHYTTIRNTLDTYDIDSWSDLKTASWVSINHSVVSIAGDNAMDFDIIRPNYTSTIVLPMYAGIEI